MRYKGKVISNTRRFNGKRYIFNYQSYRKSDAQSQAESLRKLGHRARVVAEKRLGLRVWVVYSDI